MTLAYKLFRTNINVAMAEANSTQSEDHPSTEELQNYIPIRRDDIPGSVRRLVEECLWTSMARCEQKLDALSCEAQNTVSDLVNQYRKLMVEALINMFETKNVITGEDIRRIHSIIQAHLF